MKYLLIAMVFLGGCGILNPASVKELDKLCEAYGGVNSYGSWYLEVNAKCNDGTTVRIEPSSILKGK